MSETSLSPALTRAFEDRVDLGSWAGFTSSLVTSAWVGHGANSSAPVWDTTINGRFYHQIFGETFVGQNIWAPYMSQALAGTPR